MSHVSFTTEANTYRFILVHGANERHDSNNLGMDRYSFAKAVCRYMTLLIQHRTDHGTVSWDEPGVPCQIVYLYSAYGVPVVTQTMWRVWHRGDPDPGYWDLVNRQKIYKDCKFKPNARGGSVEIPGLWDKEVAGFSNLKDDLISTVATYSSIVGDMGLTIERQEREIASLNDLLSEQAKRIQRLEQGSETSVQEPSEQSTEQPMQPSTRLSENSVITRGKKRQWWRRL